MKKGDQVIVVMARNSIFPWQVGPKFPAVFVQHPQGPGDTFMVEVAACGVVHLNGNASDFIGLYPALTPPLTTPEE